METTNQPSKIRQDTLDGIKKMTPEEKERLIETFHKKMLWFKKSRFSIFEIVHDQSIDEEIDTISRMNIVETINENAVYLEDEQGGWECRDCGILKNENQLDHILEYHIKEEKTS